MKKEMLGFHLFGMYGHSLPAQETQDRIRKNPSSPATKNF